MGRRAGTDPGQRSWELGLYSMGHQEECAYFQKAKDAAKCHLMLAVAGRRCPLWCDMGEVGVHI